MKTEVGSKLPMLNVQVETSTDRQEIDPVIQQFKPLSSHVLIPDTRGPLVLRLRISLHPTFSSFYILTGLGGNHYNVGAKSAVANGYTQVESGSCAQEDQG
jgi:hypothetical protein